MRWEWEREDAEGTGRIVRESRGHGYSDDEERQRMDNTATRGGGTTPAGNHVRHIALRQREYM